VRYTAEGVRRVRASSRDLSPKLTWPFTPPHSFINHGLDARRRFATATLPLADARATAKAFGATITDLVLATSAGALRTLQLRVDGSAERLLASVPVTFDSTPDRLSGNRFSGMLVPLPTDVDDPVARLREARACAASSKEAHHLLGPELLFRWSEYLPPAASRLFDLLSARQRPNRVFTLPISNVRGPTRRGRFDQGVVSEIYSVGPLTVGSGLNITVWSFVDQLNISVLSDGLTVIDPHEVTGAMIDDFVALRAAAGMESELTAVPTAMPNTV
jgi:diacylglycerol O-acyltransferase